MHVLHQLGHLRGMFSTKQFMDEHLRRESELMALERNHVGEGFGLFRPYEMHSTLDKTLHITQAPLKEFYRDSDRYRPKMLFYNLLRRATSSRSPVFAHRQHRLAPLIKRLADRLGVAPAEDGRLGWFRPYKSAWSKNG
eukprot:6180628-Pleurochrysis_carterae.AAC.1